MSWKARLRDLAMAGGTLLAAGCGMQSCCNGNPDPCCSEPNGTACQAEHDCLAQGGEWQGSVCTEPADLSGEAPQDLSGVDHATTD